MPATSPGTGDTVKQREVQDSENTAGRWCRHSAASTEKRPTRQRNEWKTPTAGAGGVHASGGAETLRLFAPGRVGREHERQRPRARDHRGLVSTCQERRTTDHSNSYSFKRGCGRSPPGLTVWLRQPVCHIPSRHNANAPVSSHRAVRTPVVRYVGGLRPCRAVGCSSRSATVCVHAMAIRWRSAGTRQAGRATRTSSWAASRRSAQVPARRWTHRLVVGASGGVQLRSGTHAVRIRPPVGSCSHVGSGFGGRVSP
jgi:hypothetical protein